MQIPVRGWPLSTLGRWRGRESSRVPLHLQLEHRVFLGGCKDDDETPRILSHCAGQLIASTDPCAIAQLQKRLSGPRPKKPMGFPNLSHPSPLPSLSPSWLPLSLPSSPSSSSPSALTTALGSPGEATASCHPASSPIVSAILAPILVMEFVLGLVGNSLAFFIFCLRTRPWTSSTVFLVSLVVADFLLILNLPLRVDYYFLHETWRFGDTACKVNLFMIATNRTASVVFLTAVALNRYLKVAWPHHALSRASVGGAARMAGGLWGALLLLNGHLLLTTHSSRSCLSYQLGTRPSASLIWHQALFVVEFFLPLALILFAIVSITLTIRRRGLDGQAGPRRAVCVLAAVVGVYTVCFLPSVVFGVASVVAFRLRACRALDVCSQLFHGSLAFTYLNSVLDPVLYCFSSPSFLRQARALLGLTQGWQGSESAKSTHRAGRRSCSGKVVATRKLQVDVSEED